MSFIIHEYRNHIRCVLTVPFGNAFRIIKWVWVTASTQTFSVKVGKETRKYNVDLDYAIYNKKNKPILYYDVFKTDPIRINGKGVGKSSNLYETVLKDASAKEVLSDGNDKIMWVIVGLLMVAVIGVALYGNYQLSQQNDKIVALTKYYTQALINATKTGGGIIIP